MLRRTARIPLAVSDCVAHDQVLEILQDKLDPEFFDAAWEAGRVLTWQQAADEALAWLEGHGGGK